LEKNIVDLQLREMASFLESKFEETFTEEQKVVRAPGVRDTHIHCVFLILDPIRLDENLTAARKKKHSPGKVQFQRLVGVLDEDLDLQVLRTLQGKTTVIPVISKADTITTAHMNLLKMAVWESLKQAKLDPLEALNLVDEEEEEEDEDRFDERDEDAYHQSGSEGYSDEDKAKVRYRGDGAVQESSQLEESDLDHENDSAIHAVTTDTRATSPYDHKTNSVTPTKGGHRRSASSMSALISSASATEIPFLPLSILSPDVYEPGAVGRRFAWGFADPYNAEHCDFTRLKESVFSEWRSELREASRDVWYEQWRTSRLHKRGTPLRVSQGSAVGVMRSPPQANGRANSGKPSTQWGQRVLSGVGVMEEGSPEAKAGQGGAHKGAQAYL